MSKFVIWSLCVVATWGGLIHAADKSTKKVVKPDSLAEIELFDGIQSKLLDVKVIALGSHRANVIIENKTAEPVMVRLPDVFAAVPVLGQFGGPLGGAGGQFGGGQFGGGQAGGLFGGQGGQFGGQGGGGLKRWSRWRRSGTRWWIWRRPTRRWRRTTGRRNVRRWRPWHVPR